MFFWCDHASVSVRINLGELSPKKQDLSGVIDPQQKSNQRTGRAIGRTGSPASEIKCEDELTQNEKNSGKQEKRHCQDFTPGEHETISPRRLIHERSKTLEMS